jgi:hypothetical protein
MKLSDFILLNIEEKKATLLHDGILVAKRSNLHHLIFLFQMNAFYVEVLCNLTKKSVQEYRAFEETKFLSPYLEAIEINHLLV